LLLFEIVFLLIIYDRENVKKICFHLQNKNIRITNTFVEKKNKEKTTHKKMSSTLKSAKSLHKSATLSSTAKTTSGSTTLTKTKPLRRYLDLEILLRIFCFSFN